MNSFYMLQHVQHKISILKIRSHYFLMCNAYHILANHWISKILLDPSISHISPPIFNHYFFKVRITMPTPSFTTPSCTFPGRWSWSTFAKFLKNLINRSGKFQSQKIAIFDLPKPLDMRAANDFVIYTNIYYIVFGFSIPFERFQFLAFRKMTLFH